ncbi:TPA: conjugal transfer protein TraT [Legionella pneumophila]|nr:conjugal transfer protein TraT [Legionella pneumophila]HBD7283631.1 complement resistance protein TraT [Legionella pneumophila]HEN8241150.1 complement resistance protein TraT [Legionella pneumophila]
MSGINNKFKVVMLSGVVATLCSCAATQTALEHGKLSTTTKMSETIFLDPVSDSQKTAYISVKNTSDQKINFESQLAQALQAHGYKVVKNPGSAHYLVQANVLKIGKMSKKASEAAVGGGFGSTLAGIGTGVAVGGLTNSTNAMIAGGLAGGLASVAADALIKDVNYAMITDIQISERTTHKIKQRTQARLQNGSNTLTTQDYSEESNLKRYRTRLVSNADKVNLNFADARPMLEREAANSIAGIF